MRPAAVVILGAVAIGALTSQYRNQPSAAWVLLLAVTAILVGFAADTRGWLAAMAAAIVGMSVWFVVELRPAPPWEFSDAGGFWTWVVFLVGNVLPVAFGSAALGALGGWLTRTWRKARA
jgi:ABC-type amino acid transport substrate-binding protein